MAVEICTLVDDLVPRKRGLLVVDCVRPTPDHRCTLQIAVADWSPPHSAIERGAIEGSAGQSRDFDTAVRFQAVSIMTG